MPLTMHYCLTMLEPFASVASECACTHTKAFCLLLHVLQQAAKRQQTFWHNKQTTCRNGPASQPNVHCRLESQLDRLGQRHKRLQP